MCLAHGHWLSDNDGLVVRQGSQTTAPMWHCIGSVTWQYTCILCEPFRTRLSHRLFVKPYRQASLLPNGSIDFKAILPCHKVILIVSKTTFYVSSHQFSMTYVKYLGSFARLYTSCSLGKLLLCAYTIHDSHGAVAPPSFPVSKRCVVPCWDRLPC